MNVLDKLKRLRLFARLPEATLAHLAALQTPAEWFLLMNNDTLVAEDVLDYPVADGDAKPRVRGVLPFPLEQYRRSTSFRPRGAEATGDAKVGRFERLLARMRADAMAAAAHERSMYRSLGLWALIDAALLADYHRIARAFREAGIPAEVYPDARKIAVQFAYAGKRGIPLALIAGIEERAKGVVNLKDLRTRESFDGLSLEGATARASALLR